MARGGREKSVMEVPLGDRPRERLAREGAATLSDADLLAVMLGRGTKGYGVLTLAVEVLRCFDAKFAEVTLDDLVKLKGLGQAKATQLLASLEFCRRRIRPEGVKISGARDVIPLLQHFADRKQEHFLVVTLNGAHEVIAYRCISVGLLNSALVHPREVYADALKERAAAIIVAHNHPSGSLVPSNEDLMVTRNLVEAGKILKIPLLDHIIFSTKGFVSLNEQGAL